MADGAILVSDNESDCDVQIAPSAPHAPVPAGDDGVEVLDACLHTRAFADCLVTLVTWHRCAWSGPLASAASALKPKVSCLLPPHYLSVHTVSVHAESVPVVVDLTSEGTPTKQIEDEDIKIVDAPDADRSPLCPVRPLISPSVLAP
jgi:hypothetical protein